jgi:hypothetical protein
MPKLQLFLVPVLLLTKPTTFSWKFSPWFIFRKSKQKSIALTKAMEKSLVKQKMTMMKKQKMPLTNDRQVIILPTLNFLLLYS